MIEPFPFIAVSGAPYERGHQYGTMAQKRVKMSADLYGNALLQLGFGSVEKSRLIKSFADDIGAFGEHYLEEVSGIAAGAGIPFDDVVMINARTEVVAKARLEKNQLPTEDVDLDEGCTGAIILPERSATENVIHGQNWDWRTECVETAVVLRVRRDDGPDFLTFVEAGGLARSGLNEAGIAITANYLECDRDFKQTGTPLALIRRNVLEQEHFALAAKSVAATPKSCSNNMMISMAAGFGVDFECAPDESFALYPQDGLIVHANHWNSQVALTKLRETGLRQTPDSIYRDWRVRKILDQAGGALTPDDLKRALFDDFGTPYAVCRPPRQSSHGNLGATVAMVIMEPAKGLMDVAPLPAQNRVFTRYSLSDEPVTLAVAA